MTPHYYARANRVAAHQRPTRRHISTGGPDVTPHYYARANRVAAHQRSIARQRHDKIARQLYRQAFGPRPGLVRRNAHWIASALLVTATLLFLGASI